MPRIYDEPHNHEPQWCICWTLGTYAQMTCRGTCHAEPDAADTPNEGGK